MNDYIREAIGPAFTSKHFRTWGATVFAAMELGEQPLPETKREQALVLNTVLDRVAATLRNTRAVCRSCYVHPAILIAWLDGEFSSQIKAIRTRARRPFKNLDPDESTVLRWLKTLAAKYINDPFSQRGATSFMPPSLPDACEYCDKDHVLSSLKAQHLNTAQIV